MKPHFLLFAAMVTLIAPRSLITSPYTAQQKTIFPTTLRVGTIQFPDTLDTVPSLAMYYKGVRLEGEKSKMAKSITYTIGAEPTEEEFYVLITPVAPQPVVIEDVTINYFKMPKKTPYICYKMIMHVTHIMDEAVRKKEGNFSYSWDVHQVVLDHERIPLNTITLIYNPSLVDKIDSGSAINLPKIHFKGSAQEHNEYAINSLLAGIDTNPFHAPESRDRIVQANLARKTIVTLTT